MPQTEEEGMYMQDRQIEYREIDPVGIVRRETTNLRAMSTSEDSMRRLGPTTLQIPRRKTIHKANPTTI